MIDLPRNLPICRQRDAKLLNNTKRALESTYFVTIKDKILDQLDILFYIYYLLLLLFKRLNYLYVEIFISIYLNLVYTNNSTLYYIL